MRHSRHCLLDILLRSVPNEECVETNCAEAGANLQVVAGADDIYSTRMQVRPIASYFFAKSEEKTIWHWKAGYTDIGKDLALVVVKEPFEENTPIGFAKLGNVNFPPLSTSIVKSGDSLDAKCSFYAKKRCCQLYYQTKSL